MTKRPLVLLSLILLLIISLTSVGAEPIPPFKPYHEKPLNGILYPRIGMPALLVNDTEFTVWVDQSLGKPSKVTLTSIFQPTIELKIIDSGFSSNVNAYYVTVVGNAPPGLYNLTVEADGKRYVEPNAVAFYDSYRPLKVVHWTDTHFGVRNLPKHSMNSLLFLSAIGTFNSLDIDLILHTGDVVDAIVSKDEEEPFRKAYEELITLRVPIIMVEGNNDYTAIEKKAYYWEKYFAPLSGYVKYGDLTFFCVDSDTGKIFGDQFGVLDRAEGRAGIGLTHYPFKDNDIRIWIYSENGTLHRLDYNETVDYLLNFSRRHGIKLWLVGHWHSDNSWKYGDVEVLLTDAGQYDHGTSYGGTAEDYGHYRLLEISSKSYSYDKTTTLWKYNITFLRVPDASSPSIALYVAGTEAKTVEIPIVLSKFSENPGLEGAKLIEVRELAGGKGFYKLRVDVQPGQRKLIILQAEPDTEPPTLKVEEIERSDRLVLFYRAYDSGTGVKEVKAYVSEDNKTWNPLKPVIETGWPTYEMPLNKSFYYRIEAYDAVGNKAVKYGYHRVKAETETPAKPTEIAMPSLEIIIVLIVIIVIIAALLILRRRS